MRQYLTVLAMLATSGSAQQVISYYYPGGYEGNPPVATITSVNPSTTEFRIACPTGTDSNDCGLGSGIDYAVISGTRYQAQMSFPGFSMSFGCDYNSKDVQMTCTADQAGGNAETSLGPQRVVLLGTDVVFNTATVVEGAGLLSGGGASATSLPKSASASASSGLMVATGLAPAPIQASGAGALETSGTQLPVQATGAAARVGVEGAALLAMVGAAAMNI